MTSTVRRARDDRKRNRTKRGEPAARKFLSLAPNENVTCSVIATSFISAGFRVEEVGSVNSVASYHPEVRQVLDHLTLKRSGQVGAFRLKKVRHLHHFHCLDRLARASCVYRGWVPRGKR